MLGFLPQGRLTGGERNFVCAVVAIGLFAGVLAIDVVTGLAADHAQIREMNFFTFWTIFVGIVGGVSGFLSSYRRYFGFDGVGGWLRAFFGGLIVSGIAAVVGGTLILPYYGTMFAPMKLIIVMFEVPAFAILWVAMVICINKLMQQWRQERDSIFTAAPKPTF